MNGNFKYTLTDEQRNTLKRKLTGKAVKGLASRADVCAILQKALDDALVGRRQIGDKIADAMAECINDEPVEQAEFNLSDYSAADVEDLVKQNKLLHSRVNRLQYRLDTEYSS